MRRRALMLCYRVPFPLSDGYRLRAYHIGRCLREEYDLDLLALTDESIEADTTRSLRQVFHRIVLFPLRPSVSRMRALVAVPAGSPLQISFHRLWPVRAWMKRNAGQYDLVLSSHLRMAQYLEGVPGKKAVDLIDALSFFYKEASEYATGAWRRIYRLESRRIAQYEREIFGVCDKALITSTHDARVLMDYGGAIDALARDRLVVIPNGVRDSLLVSPPATLRETAVEDWLVFLGKMDYAPNVDAVISFCRTTWPALRAENPNLRFLIVGTQPRRCVLALRSLPGVDVTGHVEDPFDYVKRAKAVVVPLRFGAGIQNKVLEAMALGKPVVTTPVGVRGVDGRNGEHFVVSNQDSLGQHIQALLSDRDRREQLGAHARSLIEAKYRWEKIGERLLDAIR
jgi:sugar transferase (PEP-CTERM/EpsH1 system associated)